MWFPFADANITCLKWFLRLELYEILSIRRINKILRVDRYSWIMCAKKFTNFEAFAVIRCLYWYTRLLWCYTIILSSYDGYLYYYHLSENLIFLPKASYECADFLLSRGASVEEKSFDNPATPLHEAASRGDFRMCELLLKYKVSSSFFQNCLVEIIS